MKKCPVCGYRNRGGFTICPRCGYTEGFNYIKWFSVGAGIFLIITFFLPWIDIGINFFTNLDMVFHTGKIPLRVKNDIGFNLRLLSFVGLYGLWLIFYPFVKDQSHLRTIIFRGYDFSTMGFFGSFLLLFYLLKFSRYLAISVYLQFLTFLSILGMGLYTLWKIDKRRGIDILDTEEITSNSLWASVIVLIILIFNYLIIPGKIIVGLKRFPEFRRH